MASLVNMKVSRPKRLERQNEGDGPQGERSKPSRAAQISKSQDSPNADVAPKVASTKSEPRIQKYRAKGIRQIFRMLLDQVDEGTIDFSDDLEAEKFPDEVGEPDLTYYNDKWKGITSDGGNLLHFAVGYKEVIEGWEGQEIVDALKNRIKFVKWLLRSEPDMFRYKNANEEEPLTYVLGAYNAAVHAPGEGVNSFNCHLQREFTHFFLSEESLREACRSILNDRSKKGYCTPHTAIKEMGVEIVPYLELFERESLLAEDKDKSMPLHVALDVEHWRNWETAQKRADLISRLIELCDDALTHKNGAEYVREELKMAPYGYHKAKCREFHASGDKICHNSSCKEVEFILKDAYMRQPESKGAMKHLYSGKQALYCHLDLSELSHVKLLPTDFLENIDEYIGHLNLDTILKRVCLPKELLNGQPLGNQEDHANYSVVFKWLREKNVRRIIKLIVEDDENLPHSDETIVSALDGIEVHSWNWKQYDLCCDTILKAAPLVRRVFLYSTGKKAVLMNWTSEEGLKRLHKLEAIEIQIDLRATRGKDTFDYEGFLKSRIEKLQLGPKVTTTVYVGGLCKYKGNAGGSLGVQRYGMNEGNQPDSWLKCMARFGEFIYNIPDEIKLKAGSPVVKIAIIDDGVNVYEPELRNAMIGGGTSFHTRGGLPDEETFTHHFPSTSGHGTEMAMRVRQVFPMATLYIARLNVRRGDQGGDATIDASSAADAIAWAAEEGVDIISMSWTVEKTDHNAIDLKRMEDAIDLAHKRNILMFCAAKDGGYAQSAGFGYPKRFGKPVFCIGSTTEHGDLAPRLGSQKDAIDFAFPGENITPLSSSAGSKIAGSSIATALASGLAGLLLYIIEFAETGKMMSGEVERATFGGTQTTIGKSLRKDLQQHERMRDTLLAMTNNQQKYIPVLNFFDIDSRNQWGSKGAEPAFHALVNNIRIYMSTTAARS